MTTPTFSPPEMLNMRTYDLMATPLVYPGQTARARVIACADNRGAISARLSIRAYDIADRLEDLDGPAIELQPGEDRTLEWRLPELDGQPTAEIGLALSASGPVADGAAILDYFSWDGPPELTLRRPGDGVDSFRNRPADGCDFWRMAWVNGASLFSKRYPPDFRIAQNVGEGLILHGTRQWTDYQVTSTITLHLGTYGGIAVRAQGRRRFYAARLTRAGAFQIVRVRDDVVTVLAETAFPVELEKPVAVTVTVRGRAITAEADGVRLAAEDAAFADGAIGLLVHEGALSTHSIHVGPVQ